MTVPGPDRLREVVSLACRAPSVHNTQPWRWRITGGDTIDLLADRSRQLRIADPVGRNLTLSCGAAVHHAVAGGQALGLRVEVDLLPEPAVADLLARLRIEVGPTRTDAQDVLRTLERRTTDRRRFTAWPVPQSRLRDLATAAAQWGASAVPVTTTAERLKAELLVARAQEVQVVDERLMAEQRRWLDRSPTDGMPVEVAVPARTPRPEPLNRFRTIDAPRLPRLVEPTDALLVLCTAHDDQLAWLRAGEALSALWFEATRNGLSVVPLSQVIEVPETRRDLQRDVLADAARPQLLLRTGWQEIGRTTMRRTPRRRLDDVLE